MKIINLIVLLLFTSQIQSQDILGLKERARIIEKLQKDRFDNLLPKLMEETGIDMWILITREYNEDPIIKTLLPPTWLNARRRTILAFYHDKYNNKVDIYSCGILLYEMFENRIYIPNNKTLRLKYYLAYISPILPPTISIILYLSSNTLKLLFYLIN